MEVIGRLRSPPALHPAEKPTGHIKQDHDSSLPKSLPSQYTDGDSSVLPNINLRWNWSYVRVPNDGMNSIKWLHQKSDSDSSCKAKYPGSQWGRSVLTSVSKIIRTDAVKINKLTAIRVRKLPMSTQLRATWHIDSLDMAVLPFTGTSRYYNCCIDGGAGQKYFEYTLVEVYRAKTKMQAFLKKIHMAVFVLSRISF
jgi:hypothetical protein